MSGGFVRTPRRASGRRNQRSRTFSILFLLMLAMMLAGILLQRVLKPAGLLRDHHGSVAADRDGSGSSTAVAGRDTSRDRPSDAAPAAHPDTARGGEQLTPADHRALDQVIRERSGNAAAKL
jgi:hypothetical protein